MIRYAKDTGIILANHPYKERDSRIDLFSRELGRIHCYANGAQHSKRRFMGCLEPTFMVHVLLEKHNGYTLRECKVANSHYALRRSLRHIQSAFYMLYICQKSLVFGQKNTALYDMLSHSLSALCQDTPLQTILSHFENQYLETEGIKPEGPISFSRAFESYTGATLPRL